MLVCRSRTRKERATDLCFEFAERQIQERHVALLCNEADEERRNNNYSKDDEHSLPNEKPTFLSSTERLWFFL